MRSFSLRKLRRGPIWLVGLLILTGATWWFSGQVQSPGQKAAEARAPEPSAITVPVEERRLRETIVLQGTVKAGREIKIAPQLSGENSPLVTKMGRRAGDEIVSGARLIEISGRPLFAFPGGVPMYRDLRPGDKGDDVAQLQTALRALGYPIADRTSVVGAGTVAAVSRFYRARGYEPTTETADQPPAGGGSNGGDGGDGGESGDGERQAEPEAAEKPAAPKKTLVIESGEVVFVPRLPARVSATSVSVGDQADGEIMRVTSGKPYVAAELDSGTVDAVKKGMSAEVRLNGTTLTGEVSAIKAAAKSGAGQEEEEPASGDDGQSAPSKTVTVRTNKSITAKWLGEKITVAVAALDTRDEVPAVPSAAVWSRADGTSFVVVGKPGGGTREIPVRVGRSADGYIELAESEGLAIGDLVLLSGEPR